MLTTDKILFGEIKHRNLKVYEALFREYYPQLVKFSENYIYDKQECEDIVQNLFIYFWENAERINLTVSIKAYLFESIRNRCINHLRDLNIHDKHNLLYLETQLNYENHSDAPDPEVILKINAAIAQLPPQMSEIFRLKYLEGKKLKEIASLSQVSENTIKTQLQRAKDKIRRILGKSNAIKLILAISFITIY
ncbi:MAG: RNA polymerase sigma-70 factor [Bacteroidia bacterium]|nr:RNA polymerase sigma-70 factor [Bacteroidia bacterium]